MKTRSSLMWMSLTVAVVALVCGFDQGRALAQTVPTCNGFDATGTIPMYCNPAPVPPSVVCTTGTTVCTDYFGRGNYANSPVPSSPITGFTLIAGGSGYVNPVVVITDPTGSGASATATPTAGVITAVTGGGGSSYVMPQVSIVDVGAGGTLAAPTCGASPLPACGSGAMATAVLGGPYTGGMLKFQDGLVDLKTLIASPDQTTFPGSDYYEIALVQYTQKMHSSLPPTTLRGYVQLPTGSTSCSATPLVGPSYLAPTIVAQKDRPVRVKFTNCLPTGTGGNLFIPTDTTYMGAGIGPDGTMYTQNRATLHLHGGASPWISDGTPHQWTVPVGETATLQKGVSVRYVPDMWFDGTTGAVISSCAGQPSCAVAGATNNPGQGSLSFFWTNQQGARLMFFHDHAYGITRLNVYAGEAAGYLLVDPLEENALAAATAPGTLGTTPDLTHLIPLVIQDKTFVPSQPQLAAQDPTWAGNFGATPLSPTGSNGDLWFPHVYTTNQNPNDPTGANGFGRWDYGAWFFPPQTSLTAAASAGSTNGITIPATSAAFPGQLLQPTSACPACGAPITPNPSGTPEGFMDTPVVNGVAYPVLHVAPAAYRFRILSVGNDRSFNLSWFVADPTQNNTEVAMLPAVPPTTGTALPLCGPINPVAIPSLDLGQATALLDANGNPLNGTGLPANCWPNYGPQPGIPAPQTMWAADGRAGGAPDPRNAGPPWIQIATEGGLLAAPVVIPATPVNYEQNTRSITITNVAVHGLWLGPAERADVIVDFSQFAGKTLIMYNDAPTPAPAFDSRLDYFTGDGDQSPIGGAPNTPPGYGPNTRTIMQVVVDQNAPNTVPFSLAVLKAAFASTATTQGLFTSTQPTTIVPEAAYNSAYNATFPNTYASIQANTLTFTPIAPLIFDQPPCAATAPAQCAVLDQKAIQELFTLDYGRMNATLGTELPLTNFLTQTTLPFGYAEWPTEITQGGQTSLWKITHNGVDTHFIHFHLFNVQVVNRMGWDGTIRPPDPNEVGWKDTVRMNPLEDILVALQPVTPSLPFPLPDSIRAMDVTVLTGAVSPGMSGIDPNTGNPIASGGTTNALVNFGWEYVWHCHILGHEENDMMRPIIHQVAPLKPGNLVAGATTNTVQWTWTDNSAHEDSFTLQRSTTLAFLPTDPGFGSFTVDGTNSTGFSTLGYAQTVTFTDATVVPGTQYYYRVQATDSFKPYSPLTGVFRPMPVSSAWSNTAVTGLFLQNVTFTGAPASAIYNTSFTVTATTDAGVMPTITGNSVCSVGAVGGTPTSATALVTMTSGTGTCTLTANWPAIGNFASATLTQNTTAVLATPTVTFTGAPASSSYNTSFLVTATTNDLNSAGATITGTNGICSVTNASTIKTTLVSTTATVNMLSGTGICTLTANWAADINYQAAVATQSTTATKDNSTTTIIGNSPNPSVAGQPVTVNFSVASAIALTAGASGPTGSVTVTGNGSSCTGTLTPGSGPGSGVGTGSCSLTFPTFGTKTLTAVYNGDSNFNTSTSAGVTQQVRDFSINLSPTSQQVNGNQNARYTVTLTSLNNFTGTVALTCGGTYPSSFACSVSPTSVTVSAGGTASAAVTVNTRRGSPGTYNVTTTGTFGTGVPTTGGETHTATATVTTRN